MSETETAAVSGMREGLLNAPQLLEAVWPDKKSRPSLRFLRNLQAARAIPFVKLGRKVFFKLEDVRMTIAERHTVAKRRP
jgi:hypothetical protein